MKASGTTIEERRTKNGNIRSYRVKFFEHGKRKSATFRTRTDAESFAQSILTARTIPSNIDISAMGIIRQIQFQELCAKLGVEVEKAYDEVCDILIKKYIHTAERNVSLGEAVKEFLKARKKSNCRDSTMNEYIHYLGWLENSFGDTYPIGSITEKKLRVLINSKDKISVQEHFLMRLKTFFRYLVREGFLTINPTVNISIEKVKKDETPPEILSVEEVEKIFKNLPQKPSVLASFALLAFAGIRPEEICPKNSKSRLAWENVDFSRREITIPGATSKIRKLRVISGDIGNIWKFLELTPEPQRKGPICNFSYSTMRRIRRKIMGKATQDILRHCFGSYGYHYLDPRVVVEIMGHVRGFKTFEKFYKGIANEAEARKYFSIEPNKKTPLS